MRILEIVIHSTPNMDENMKEWLIKHYKHTANKEIQDKFGITHYMLHKYAKEFGLKKSYQFIRKVAKANSEKGLEVLAEKGWPPKGYVIPNQGKKIESLKARKGERRPKAIREKCAEAIRNTFKSEKRRVLFGLPQKTKLKVVKAPKGKIHCRWKMRKLGYIIDKGGNVAYYNETTIRNKHFEERIKQYGVMIQELNN